MSDNEIHEMSDADIHAELKLNGVSLHHKTGSERLRVTLAEVRAGTYVKATPDEPAAPKAPKGITKLSAAEGEKRLTKEQRAMQLIRVVVSPNDPLMSSYPGLIFTVGSSSINQGRMIKKFVPFNNDTGYHIPRIIYDQIEGAQMQKFRPVKLPNGEKSQQAYLTKKFNVQILPPLTPVELKDLAAAQLSRGDA